MSWTRLRLNRGEALCAGAGGSDGVDDSAGHIADAQRQTGQRAAHVGDRVVAGALAPARWQVGLWGGSQAHHRGDVVGQDFAGYVDDQRLLRQARENLDSEAAFETFASLFEAPALIMDICKEFGREGFFVQVGGQNADRAIAGDLASQTPSGMSDAAAAVAFVIGAGLVERHPETQSARVQEFLGCAAATVVVAAHDKAGAVDVEQSRQLGGCVAAVEHADITGPDWVERADEPAAFVRSLAVHADVKERCCAGQVQRKQAPIGIGRRALEQTRPYGRHQHRGIGDHHTQAASTLDETGLIGTLNDATSELGQRGRVLAQTEAKRPASVIRCDRLRIYSDASTRAASAGSRPRTKALGWSGYRAILANSSAATRVDECSISDCTRPQ